MLNNEDRLEKDECLMTNGPSKEFQDDMDDIGCRMVKAVEDDYSLHLEGGDK